MFYRRTAGKRKTQFYPKEFDTIARIGYKAFDYVIRRLNALLTGVKDG
jgi:hypothetical protein